MKHFGIPRPSTKVTPAVVVVLLVAAAAAATHPGTWTARENLPAEMFLTATAEVDGIIYTIGGWSNNNVLDTVLAFDPAGNHWTMKAPMPTPRGQAVAGVVDGKIYVIGGAVDGHFTATGVVEVYDPATDKWQAQRQAEERDIPSDSKRTPADLGPRSMPTGLWSPAAAVVDGKIYVIGGGTGDALGGWSVYSGVQIYDPESNSWDTGTDMPTARCSHSVSVIDGLIYAAGGASDDEILGAFEVYDPSTDSWTTAADMLTARDWLATAAVDEKVYAFGGLIWEDRVVHEVEFFDPNTGKWELETRMPFQRWGQGLAVVDGTIYQIGGAVFIDYWQQSRYVDAYDPDLYTSWTEVAAHLDGAYASQWRTGICAANFNGETANVELFLHTGTATQALSATIEPTTQKAFHDVVGEMGVDGKGLLQISSDQPLRLAGRTYNDGGNGTFGQFCDFQPMDAGFFTDDQVYLIGLHQKEGFFRTNVVLANTGIRDAFTIIGFVGCDGTSLGSLAITLAPGTVEQIIEPLANDFGAPNVGWAYAVVKVIYGAGVRVSASVIDSRTNDATTIVAER